ncbi:MAG: hypothetical protein M3416_05165 [Acidobacteriota bacterium]|nr:hypothetical protein [Acidobacteriota bacterium]
MLFAPEPLHEGLPLASEISKKGLNAFVIRYRISEQDATEDLAAAIAFVFRNAETTWLTPPDKLFFQESVKQDSVV